MVGLYASSTTSLSKPPLFDHLVRTATDIRTMDVFSDVPWAALLILGPLVFLSYHFYVYPAHLSPLSKIPNAHWSAPISSFWILHKRFRRRENGTLEDAHRRLGPFVRVAPNEVSVDDLSGVRTIYQGGFEKPEWYEVFDNYG